MTRSSPRQHWTTWIAILAIVLGALAPTVSRWLARHQAVPLALLEVCATREGGTSMVMIKAEAYQQHPANTNVLDHCPLCTLQGDHGGLPPVVFDLALVNGLSEQAPRLFYLTPKPLHVWTAALARAPPVALV